jgi:hypothetical protein
MRTDHARCGGEKEPLDLSGLPPIFNHMESRQILVAERVTKYQLTRTVEFGDIMPTKIEESKYMFKDDSESQFSDDCSPRWRRSHRGQRAFPREGQAL